jgi:hypothetical protein
MLFAALDERKREHLVEQFFQFSQGSMGSEGQAFAARFRKF